ncbi:ABC transporter permease [Brevibacterium sp. W7.2]|uniref:ABC transporter permease n=1 Tax=Brevibacterium sp. W7.2 TaxID=2823518 RepID=UPI001BAE0A24|nr:ABC transporter permease [Brevibacterium sp. W7.2]
MTQTPTTPLTAAAPEPARHPIRWAWADTATMVKRQFVHAVRYPVFMFLVGAPIVILLLFVYVFGGTLGRGLGGDSGDYLAYVMPGIIVLTFVGGMQLTALSMSQDMNEGIVTRFRSMSISRGAVMAGHVISNGLQQVAAVLLVLGLALILGFRPAADGLDWLGLVGFCLLLIVSLGWLSVALGVMAKSVETASNVPMLFMLLPMVGSGFVPTDTMPRWMQIFADAQPFTPIIETIRGLLMGTPPGSSWWISLLWIVGLGVLGYVLARAAYERRAAE